MCIWKEEEEVCIPKDEEFNKRELTDKKIDEGISELEQQKEAMQNEGDELNKLLKILDDQKKKNKRTRRTRR